MKKNSKNKATFFSCRFSYVRIFYQISSCLSELICDV